MEPASSCQHAWMPKASLKTRVDAASRSVSGVLTVEAGELLLQACCSDDTFLYGPSLQGVSLGVEKPGAFLIEYDVGSRTPKFCFSSAARLGGRRISLTYAHKQQPHPGCTSLESSLAIDERNKVTCSYDFSSNAGRLRYSFTHADGTLLQPAFDFGSKTWDLSASRQVTKDDKLTTSYRGKDATVAVEWSRLSGDAGGPLKLYADIPLRNGKPPKVMLEKVWSC